MLTLSFGPTRVCGLWMFILCCLLVIPGFEGKKFEYVDLLSYLDSRMNEVATVLPF